MILYKDSFNRANKAVIEKEAKDLLEKNMKNQQIEEVKYGWFKIY